MLYTQRQLNNIVIKEFIAFLKEHDVVIQYCVALSNPKWVTRVNKKQHKLPLNKFLTKTLSRDYITTACNWGKYPNTNWRTLDNLWRARWYNIILPKLIRLNNPH